MTTTTTRFRSCDVEHLTACARRRGLAALEVPGGLAFARGDRVLFVAPSPAAASRWLSQLPDDAPTA